MVEKKILHISGINRENNEKLKEIYTNRLDRQQKALEDRLARMVQTEQFDLDNLIGRYKALLGQFDKNNLDAFLDQIQEIKAIDMDKQKINQE